MFKMGQIMPFEHYFLIILYKIIKNFLLNKNHHLGKIKIIFFTLTL